MALSTAPLSELDAVNMMLLAIGESPINDLDDTGLADGSLARTLLHDVSRGVQIIGWYWNSESQYPLVPALDGSIYVPSNALRADPSDPSVQYVLRGSRVYDRVNHTYEFAAPVLFDIVFFLPWEELPHAARQYIVHRAARMFQEKTLGSTELSSMDQRDEKQAWALLLAEEAEVADFNILSSLSVTDRRGV